MSGSGSGPESGNDHETVLRGERVAYSIRESTRASQPRIDVRPAGVTVVVPEADRGRVDPDAVLDGHAEWVLEKRAAMTARRERAPDRSYGPGATWSVLGAEREVVVERRRSSAVDREADLIRLARSHVDRTSHKRALEYCFRETAREEFERRVAALAPEMGVADAVGDVEVRNQRTRWGSCSSSGTVSLNWRLLLAPPAVLRYVVVHELAHLRRRDHSDAFWEIVAAHDPGVERHRDWLREHADELIFDETDL